MPEQISNPAKWLKTWQLALGADHPWVREQAQRIAAGDASMRYPTHAELQRAVQASRLRNEPPQQDKPVLRKTEGPDYGAMARRTLALENRSWRTEMARPAFFGDPDAAKDWRAIRRAEREACARIAAKFSAEAAAEIRARCVP